MRTLAIIAAFALAACATAPVAAQQSRGGHEGVSATLDAENAGFSAAYMRGDVEAVLAAYAPDALVQTPEGGVVSTPEALRALWAPIANIRPGTTHALTSTYRQFTGADEVLEAGLYEISTRTAEGETRWRRGCYTLVWRRIEGHWRIEYDSWTRPLDPAQSCEPT
jgi:ketosteroid isomerase-like protein